MMGGPGGASGPGAGGPGGGGRQAMMGGLGGPGRGAGGPGGMSDEDRQKMQAAMKKALNGRNPQDLTPEERVKMGEEIRKAMGGKPGAPGAGGRPGGMPMMMASRGQFSEKDLANAQLPPAVEADNQLDVLLRPGLLADVEIIVEKIPNAINIPAQAVFEKDGKQIVYVRNGNRWDERPIKPLKRSESTMVISEGVKAGETIAMADPNAKPGDKKKDKGSGSSSGSPMGGMGAK